MEWSGLSYDNTRLWALHVASRPFSGAAADRRSAGRGYQDPFRWVFLSDVCKHCANAGCLEACPTGSIVRTEFASVYVQPDICNGCGYCVVSCPFGVIDKRPDEAALQVHILYDRQKVGLMPACATACPTQSIQFGPSDELQSARQNAWPNCRTADTRMRDSTMRAKRSVGGIHSFSIILGEPENYNLPPAPEVPTVYLKSAWTSAFISAAILVAWFAAPSRCALRLRQHRTKANRRAAARDSQDRSGKRGSAGAAKRIRRFRDMKVTTACPR